MSEMRVRVAVEKFLAWAGRNLAEGTVREYRRYLQWFTREVKNCHVGKLRAYHLVTWGTTWHRVQAVQRCWNWLLEVEYIKRSPFAKIKLPKLGKRKRIFTRAEFARLLRAARIDFRAFLIAMRESGARPQEVRVMRWDQIFAADAQLKFDDALGLGRCYFLFAEYKARERRNDPDEPRLIPISRRFGRMLQRLAKRCKDRKSEVFQTQRGRAWTKESVRLRMQRLRRRLKFGVDQRGEQLVAYSIRHTTGTTMTVAGVPEKIIAQIFGHSNTRTTQRYQHPQPGDLLNAMDRLRPAAKKR